MHVLLCCTGGILLELVPLRVHEPAGSRAEFTCRYRSNERLSIEFAAYKTDQAAVRLFSKREVLGDFLSRYSWGATRKWELVLQREHRTVACILRNSQGLVVGQIMATVNTGSVVQSSSYYKAWVLL